MKGQSFLSITEYPTGKEPITTHYIVKSTKGKLRDHRKGKCDRFCYFCEQEANAALWDIVKKQTPLEPEFEHVLAENLWELME